jgi:hypothetical protein
MLNTLRFVHTTITQKLVALALPEDVAHLVLHRLIPALYLQRVAKKARGAQKRKALRATSERILAELTSLDSLFMRLDDAQRTSLYSFAKTCAWLFQPSSSCVEGRNGRLSLFHHGLHHLSPKRLSALTAIHNFFITDSWGRTPAERFFGQPHDSLFDHLIAHMPLPARPAAARPRAMSESLHCARADRCSQGFDGPMCSSFPNPCSQEKCAQIWHSTTYCIYNDSFRSVPVTPRSDSTTPLSSALE